MKIGIIAWGSLITNTGELSVKNDTWFNDGPKLPVEFARISKNKRITLVIYPPFEEITTYYNISSHNDLDSAKENLAKREGTTLNNIGSINFKSGEIISKKIPTELKKTLSIWNLNKDFDALIWTDLNENFKEKLNKQFSLESSFEYLKSLSTDELDLAKEYILSAPVNTRTRHREALTTFINNL